MSTVPFVLPLSHCLDLYLPGEKRLLSGYRGPCSTVGPCHPYAVMEGSTYCGTDPMWSDGSAHTVHDFREEHEIEIPPGSGCVYGGVGITRADLIRLPLSSSAVRHHVVDVLAEGSAPIDLAWATRHSVFGGPAIEVAAFVLAVTWARVQEGLEPIRGVAVRPIVGEHPWRVCYSSPGPRYGTKREQMDRGFVVRDGDTLTALVPADCWLAKETHHVRK